MNISIQYFGQIAEALNKEAETLELNDGADIEELTELLLSIHPKLQEFVFKISVNLSIPEQNIIISENDKIAILPPFAGG